MQQRLQDNVHCTVKQNGTDPVISEIPIREAWKLPCTKTGCNNRNKHGWYCKKWHKTAIASQTQPAESNSYTHKNSHICFINIPSTKAIWKLTSKLSHFLVQLELPSGVDRFYPTFFVSLCTFANELPNFHARKSIKVPDVSRHSGQWLRDWIDWKTDRLRALLLHVFSLLLRLGDERDCSQSEGDKQ